MGIKSLSQYTCDRCGYQTTDPSAWVNHESGQLNVQYHGSIGSSSYNGDCGGININEKKWLCLSCTRKFLSFMSNEK